MDWVFDSNVPIYTQLVYKFKRAIVAGEFKCGEKLPAVRDIATQAGVNPNTMQRAFTELERLGLVYTQRSSGRYVTEDAGVIEETKNALAGEHTLDYVGSMRGLGYEKGQIITWVDKIMEEEHGNI